MNSRIRSSRFRGTARLVAAASAMSLAAVGFAGAAGATPPTPTRTVITATINGYEQATVRFSGPGGDNFSIAYSTSGSMTSPTVAGTQTGTAPFTISNLEGGVVYYVQVTDTTSSAVSNVQQAKPFSVPAAPTGVSASRVTNTEASVSWSAPSNNGGSAITGYEITAYIGDEAQKTVFDFTPSSTTANVTGLTEGSSYTFAVSAENAYGTGPLSSDSNEIIMAIPPTPPTITTATAGSTWVNLSWDAPSSTGGSPVTGYTITSYISGVSQGAASTTPAILDGTSTSAHVQGLTNGVTYTFTVTAVNKAGAGTESTESSPQIPYGTTFGVTGFAVTPGNGVANLSWTSVNDNGSPVTSWTILTFVGGVAQAPITGIAANATSYQVTGLSNGTTYLFKVLAVNAAGPGSPSKGIQVTPTTTPGVATNLAAAPAGRGKASLTWTSASTGGAAIKYTISAYRGLTLLKTDSNISGAATSYVMSGISAGSGTTFVIVASNINGPGLQSSPSNAITIAS